MNIIIDPISNLTATLIKWLYNLLASYGIKNMIVTIIALALFSRLLMFATRELGNLISKIFKNQTLSKIIRGCGIALSIIIGIGVFFVMKNIGTYIPELKNSMFLTMSPLKLYSADKSKLIYYIAFIGIEVFYILFNHLIIPKIAGYKTNLKSKTFSVYITCSICASGFVLPVAILIYWAMTSIISMVITTIKLIFRKLRGKPLVKQTASNPSSFTSKLNKLLNDAATRRSELKNDSNDEIIEVEEEPRVNFGNKLNEDK